MSTVTDTESMLVFGEEKALLAVTRSQQIMGNQRTRFLQKLKTAGLIHGWPEGCPQPTPQGSRVAAALGQLPRHNPPGRRYA